ncbi:MAG: hypothetical protein D6770_08800 [Anaerolineae bacterium]|nr:MAG: hypothetical protein D6770_08800 [Anaerolineae bacterium]
MFISVTLFLTLLACNVLDIVPQPVSEVGPDTLSTMVAGTAAALMTQTAQAMPTATPSPLPTSTFTPPIPPPSPTLPAGTLTPSAVSAVGTSLIRQDDGTVVFTDITGNYDLLVPAGWLVVRINEPEYYEAWTLPEASSEEIRRSLASIQSYDPERFRLFAFDGRAGHIENGFVTNINLLWDPHDTSTIEEAVQKSEQELPQSIPGLTVTDTQITETTLGEPVGLVSAEWDGRTVTGQTVRAYQRQAIFDLPTGLLVITLTTTANLKEAILPEFEFLVNSVSPSE